MKKFHSLSCLLAALWIVLVFMPVCAGALVCSTPGKDGVNSALTGTVNTYFPATASVSAGATSITLGNSSGAGTPIASGDLLLVIQMQDADINSTNSTAYGANNGTGAGYTALNQSGLYEFVKATNTVGVGGGTVTLETGLVNSYRNRNFVAGVNGQSRFQVVRVPQYSSATVTGALTAPAWNGTRGGIVALDVAGDLSINGTITVDGLGFRGGYGRGGTTATTGAYRSAVTNFNGSKGEGIAGTPRYMNRPAAFNGAPAPVDTGTDSYPNGSNARGAPGNAGGGGTDGAADNSQNSGGGGGGNYGAGAKGGNSWNSNLTVGGNGGSGVPVIAFNRVVMGGGGGAGTTNDSTADNTTYTNPPGIACSSAGGACSSGAPGGGIIILRAQRITGSGSVSARGGSGYNVGNDSAGGGGAGGSIILESQLGGNATATVSGGDGGNAWRSGGTSLADRHGPGGGGSGGFVAYSPAIGFSITPTYAGGISGKSTTLADSYGSGSSVGGIMSYQAPNIPGSGPGFACLPSLLVLKSADKPAAAPGDIITYTVTVTNTGAGTAANVVVNDFLSPYVQGGLNSYGAGTAFQFVNGSPSSGLALGVPVYSNDNGSTWVYTPSSGGGGAPAGYDGNITNWRMPMNGTMDANNANFTINYKVRVK